MENLAVTEVESVKAERKTKCPHGGFGVHSGIGCQACLEGYWDKTLAGLGLGMSPASDDALASGSCPSCNSRVHYLQKNGDWECADCGCVYKENAHKAAAVEGVDPEGAENGE